MTQKWTVFAKALSHTEPAAPAEPIRNHQNGCRLGKLNEVVSSAISVAAPTWPVVQFRVHNQNIHWHTRLFATR